MPVIDIAAIDVRGRSRKSFGDIAALAESIERIGLLHPIVVLPDNKLVVGRRRIEAFKLLGRKAIPANVATNLDELRLLLQAERDENTCREPYTPEEAVHLGGRIEVDAAKLAKEAERAGGKSGGKQAGSGRPKNRGGKSLPTPIRDESKRTTSQAASASGMSRPTYEKAKEVVASGNRELIDEMNEKGKVDKAYKKLKAKQKADSDAAAAKCASEQLTDDANGVHLGDSFTLAGKIANNSVALMFTDPPYDRDSLPMFSQLGDLAARILVDGGSLVTYCGQYVLPEVISRLGVRLRYFWIACCLHTGGTAQMREYGVKVKWKPMLWFVKGKFRRDRETWIEDLITSREEKDGHPWQQSVIEASHFIEKLTVKGEIVVDPFCGSGTTAFAAKELGRQWWTADTNATHVKTARDRLS